MKANELIGKKIHITGIVQGVGFRPFIYTIAHKHHITGWVRNSSAGVDIAVSGRLQEMDAFLQDIRAKTPPLAKIDRLEVSDADPDGFQDFRIIASSHVEGGFIPISPDISICEDCLRELFDPHDRRYRYPFINCTNCGPRFTIIKDIPYDRPLTTMADFKMCPDCEKEYRDPLDRRFHAQPVACQACGPQVWFEAHGQKLADGEIAIQTARSWLKQGKIIALKGLGGFHLACDASKRASIEELRQRKHRSEKSFAVMVHDLAAAEKYCEMNAAQRQLLTSKEKPIVILPRRPSVELPSAIAPGVKSLGIMLPYTPLHYLLLEPEPDYPDIFIMTSGNVSEEPIVYANKNALIELSDIADGFLMNNRSIQMRVDDSVAAEVASQPYFFRRSRGFAPNPVNLETPLHEVLAVGAELKNTFCLTRGTYAFVSHHIGDLENLETLQAFEQGIPHYEHVFNVHPACLARDLHPDYLSFQYAEKRAKAENLPLFDVQHHHAHLAACLGDNRWHSTEAVIGVIFDGTGLGTDGKIWGGEFLCGGYRDFERKAHLAYYPLPGGDLAVRQPKRIAAAYLYQAGLDWSEKISSIQAFEPAELEILSTQLQKGINCPQTSSMGRLFDAVASLVGLRQVINYEAQAAIELENIADPDIDDYYSFGFEQDQVDPAPLLAAVLADLDQGIRPGVISAKFHNGVVRMLVEVCRKISTETGCRTVALSGGVWQNLYLLKHTLSELESTGFKVLYHHDLPPNDGCIALGQALIANERMSK
jgi:hydrogenase maturation protein HypF